MITKKLTITNFINNEFKQYALYTLTSRGIPDFYDSLTPVQRLILLNTPLKNTKTFSVVGDCFKDGYHHGNSALESAINRITRPYDCAESLLIGSGFFGNQVTNDAASARYTSIKINPIINDIIDKHKYLNKKDEEGNYKHLSIDIPIGLLLPIIGIAVGYKTITLPRNLKDIQAYLSGKKKKLKPYFKDFKGTIEKYDNLDNAWLLEGQVIIDEKNKTIKIISIPPLMKYQSFIKKLDKILDKVEYTIQNNSKSDIHISIQLSKLSADDWLDVKNKIIKATKLIIKESIILVKDRVVLEYDSIEDYLEDFIIKNEYLKRDALNFNIQFNIKELKYLEAKLEYLLWMNKQKKAGIKLTENDIDKFLGQYKPEISNRLDDIKLRKLNEDEIRLTTLKIKEYIENIKNQNKEFKIMGEFLKTLPIKLNTKNKNIISIYDGDEVKEIDEIEVFLPKDDVIVEDEILNT